MEPRRSGSKTIRGPPLWERPSIDWRRRSGGPVQARRLRPNYFFLAFLTVFFAAVFFAVVFFAAFFAAM
jgi:hypothetical protein